MQNDTYELLNSMSDEDLKLIENGIYSPLEKIKNKKTDNNQQPQQPIESYQSGINPNKGIPPEKSQNLYANNSMGRNLASGVASGIYDNARGIADLIGLNLKPRQFWGDPESNSFGLGKFLGEWGTPGFAAWKAGKKINQAVPALKKVASWLPDALGVGAVGAAVHPGTINERLVTGAGEAALVPAFHGLVKGYKVAKEGVRNTRNNLNYAIPEKFQKNTNETLHDIFQGKPVTSTRENELVYGQINKKGQANKAQSNEMYDEAIQEAIDSGYNGVEKAIEFNTKYLIKHKKHSKNEKQKLSFESLFKDFKKNEKQKLSFKNHDDFIKHKKIKDAIHKDHEIKERFYAFDKQPSFKNAHDLQAMLNEKSFKLKHPLNDIASQGLGKTYGELREELLRAMNSTLEKNGDINVLESYKNATKNYAENVVPYIKTRSMRDIVESNLEKGKYIFPEDPISFLTKNKNSTQKVVSDLPNESKRFLLQKMIEDAKKGEHINFVELKKLISDIKATRKVNLVHKEDLMRLEDLLKQGKRLEKTREFVNKNKGKLILGGVLSVPGFIGGKKVLKELFSDNKD